MRPADIAHGILPWLGVILAMQAPITAWLVNVGVPLRAADLALGGVGLIVTAWSKHIDSASYTAIQTSGAAPVPNPTPNATVPPAAPWGPAPPAA